MSELDPNHPVLQRAREQWPKLLAITLHKLGLSELEITMPDLKAFGDERTIVLDQRGGRLVLRLVSQQEAERITREEGGVPL